MSLKATVINSVVLSGIIVMFSLPLLFMYQESLPPYTQSGEFEIVQMITSDKIKGNINGCFLVVSGSIKEETVFSLYVRNNKETRMLTLSPNNTSIIEEDCKPYIEVTTKLRSRLFEKHRNLTRQQLFNVICDTKDNNYYEGYCGSKYVIHIPKGSIRRSIDINLKQ